MSFDFSKIRKGKRDHKKIFLIYGTPGIGKTTAASKLPATFFIPVEDGTADLDVAQYDFGDNRVKAETYEEVDGLLDMVIDQGRAMKEAGKKFPIQNVVIDSVSALETLVHKKVCETGDDKGQKKENIEDFGFQGGYKRALKIWADFLNKIRTIRDELGVHVWLIGHSTIRGVKTPDVDPYDRYEPALHKDAVALLYRDLDGVLFAKEKVIVRKKEVGMGGTKNFGTQVGEAVLFTKATPALVAKNRSQPSLPAEMPFDLNNILESWNQDQ